MIVITNPTSILNEIEIIHALFEEGLELLHIRKPEYSEVRMALFIQQIEKEFRKKLVLHSQHQIAELFGINHFYFTKNDRKNEIPNKYLKSSTIPLTKSTSTHSIEEFNSLSTDYDYAFLSPVFPSISKENYFSKTDLLKSIKNRTNFNTKLIALGGIEPKNTAQALENGFDNVALLGTIWCSNNPIQNFKSCQKIVKSF
ncbi:thiamine phosphate synthase [Flavobacterium agrisoli]|uniref:Thiamine phosphate synthase n=1 Tax=Flavobacterium agrisoli TaxID=2793066 RepID=A0A934UKI1_9FLAO|nr:thiamine phosphate synthase [Flavobacterium agrisoli]MBK0370997.1 thiamine phosphate synthase [Flavobacterium agrisoli]